MNSRRSQTHKYNRQNMKDYKRISWSTLFRRLLYINGERLIIRSIINRPSSIEKEMVLFLLFFLFFFFFLQQKTRARPSLKKRANRAYRVVCRRVAIAIVFDSTRINAANRERRVTREGREKVGEIHGGSMLHVLPAGTYGLRPAVNRSNTRTWCATLRTSECARALARWPVVSARALSLSLLCRRRFFFLQTYDRFTKARPELWLRRMTCSDELLVSSRA